jgi:hypothetical protein
MKDIQSAKDKAAREFNFTDWNSLVQAILLPNRENKLDFGIEQVNDRAIELAIEAEMERLLGALPNDVTIYDKAVDAKYTATARTAYDQGARWMRTELAELLTPTDKP